MFISNCYIRKNSPEILAKLKNLGYHICQCCTFNGAIWLSINKGKVHGWGYTSQEDEIQTQEEALNFFLCGNKDLNCGTNENLFLELAKMRSDIDKGQWFVCIAEHVTPNMNTFKVGDMVKCRSEKAVISKIAPSWRRATAQEVYDHLKKR